jgi:hypothetical protein
MMGGGDYLMGTRLCADPVDLFCCFMLLEERKVVVDIGLTLIVRCVVGLQGCRGEAEDLGYTDPARANTPR